MFAPLKVLVIAFSFLRSNENRDPYGVSCLIAAFKNSLVKHRDDQIFSLVIDLNTEQNSTVIVCQIIDIIIQLKPNIVAFSNFVWADRYIKIALPIIKKEFPNLKILMGGAMVHGDEKTLKTQYPEVDLFVVSYGEAVFADIRSALNSRKFVVEIPPEFSQLESPYLTGEILVKKDMSVRLETRRGCKFKCSYCRHRNVNGDVYVVGNDERILAELKLFAKKEVKKINVLDPLFNDICRDMSKARGIWFLEKCKEVGINAEICVQIRPELINEAYLETASHMKNVTFEIGIQSLDTNVYPHINRGNEKAEKIVFDRLKEVIRHGINTKITLIYGLPNQSFESFEKDVNTLNKMGFGDVKAFPLQIYPATEIFENYASFGLKVKPVEPFGILEVYDNKTKDFAKMTELALKI